MSVLYYVPPVEFRLKSEHSAPRVLFCIHVNYCSMGKNKKNKVPDSGKQAGKPGQRQRYHEEANT